MSKLTKKEIILNNSRLIGNYNTVSIYQVPLKVTKINSFTSVKTFEVKELGESLIGQKTKEKVILVVGATGAGKTTLIDGILNFVLDVKFDDKFRFKLVDEPTNKSQAHSQTEKVTVYTLHHHDEYKVPFTLSIVDTPGFADTDGIGRDKEIAQEIHDFFHSDPIIVHHMDSVCFAVKASDNRLSVQQKYIFDSLLSLFGKDLSENIFVMTTFCDGNKPLVINSMKEAKIPYVAFFKFNNSALFPDTENITDDAEDYLNDMNKMFWNTGMKSFQKYFVKLHVVDTKSLKLTQEVLHNRAQTELHMEKLHIKIREGQSKLECLKKEEEELKNYKEKRNVRTLEDSFNYEIEEEKMYKKPLPEDTYTTTCMQCMRTCHDICAYKNDDDKIKCWAMDNSENPRCRICAGKCEWYVHKNSGYLIKFKKENIVMTAVELKQRYQEAEQNVEKTIECLKKDFSKIELQVIYYVHEVRKCASILKEIALKDNPLTDVDYIDLLIETEKAEHADGWQGRLQNLEKLRKMVAELAAALGDEGYEKYFEEYGNNLPHVLPESPVPQNPNFWSKTKGKGHQ